MVLEIDSIVEAVVVRTEVYGIYLDHVNETILVTIPEISWVRRGSDCRKFIAIGEVFKVKVLQLDRDRGIFSGSIRAAHPEENPWRDPAQFAIGTRWIATVTHRLHFDNEKCAGFIAELVPGVSGILRPELDAGILMLKIGQDVPVEVASIDLVKECLELRLCQLGDIVRRDTVDPA